MDRYTQETAHWLDLRFDRDVYRFLGRPYDPYQPICGVGDGEWEPSRFLMAARLSRLAAILGQVRPSSFLDIGGAEGWVAAQVRSSFGADVFSVDLSHQAALRAREFFDVPSAAADSSRLPFADRSFDVVFLSEVLEHLAHPVRSLFEALRVTRRVLVVTTEAFASDETSRQAELDGRELSPHMDRSIFCRSDFELIFPPLRVLMSNQCSTLPEPVPQCQADVRSALIAALSDDSFAWPSHGIVALAVRDPAEAASLRLGGVPGLDCALTWFAPRKQPTATSERRIDAATLVRFRCPACAMGRLTRLATELVSCMACGVEFPVWGEVPKFLTPSGHGFPQSLDSIVAAQCGADELRSRRILELGDRLRFDLPEPERRLCFGPEELRAWSTANATLEVGDGVLRVTAVDEDPTLESPRIRRPMTSLRGIRVRVACSTSSRGSQEQLQVYFWTLRRPVYWELGSTIAKYAADGCMREFVLELPVMLRDLESDELLQIRVDPGHGAGGYAVECVEIITV